MSLNEVFEPHLLVAAAPDTMKPKHQELKLAKPKVSCPSYCPSPPAPSTLWAVAWRRTSPSEILTCPGATPSSPGPGSKIYLPETIIIIPCLTLPDSCLTLPPRPGGWTVTNHSERVDSVMVKGPRCSRCGTTH